jgi:hypothetical protein
LDVLVTLVEAFERENYPIDLPDPIEAIKFRLEQEGKDASSIRVTTEMPISVLPTLLEIASSICRAFRPSRSAVISTLESRISPMLVG